MLTRSISLCRVSFAAAMMAKDILAFICCVFYFIGPANDYTELLLGRGLGPAKLP